MLFRECTMTFRDSKMEAWDKRRGHEFTESVKWIRTALLKAAKAFLPGSKAMYLASDWVKDFLMREASQRLKGLFMADGRRGMLGGKGYCSLDMFYPFVT